MDETRIPDLPTLKNVYAGHSFLRQSRGSRQSAERPKVEAEGRGRAGVGFLGDVSEPPPHQLGSMIFHSFGQWKKPIKSVKISSYSGFESASRSCSLCTRMWVWHASGRSVGRSGLHIHTVPWLLHLQHPLLRVGGRISHLDHNMTFLPPVK